MSSSTAKAITFPSLTQHDPAKPELSEPVQVEAVL